MHLEWVPERASKRDQARGKNVSRAGGAQPQHADRERDQRRPVEPEAERVEVRVGVRGERPQARAGGVRLYSWARRVPVGPWLPPSRRRASPSRAPAHVAAPSAGRAVKGRAPPWRRRGEENASVGGGARHGPCAWRADGREARRREEAPEPGDLEEGRAMQWGTCSVKVSWGGAVQWVVHESELGVVVPYCYRQAVRRVWRDGDGDGQ